MKRADLNCLNKDILLLPIKRKVIFVDWFGVLSEEVFFNTRLSNFNNSLNNKISSLRQRIFEDDFFVQEWMKGNYFYEDILENTDLELSEKDKQLIKKSLLAYCNNIRLNQQLVKILNSSANKAFIVLATDNMDCFYQSLGKLPQIGIFDYVLSSNFLGVLKRDNPNKFFGDWLKNHGLSFQDSLLIDDSEANCEAFKRCGGNTIRYSATRSDELNFISDWIKS